MPELHAHGFEIVLAEGVEVVAIHIALNLTPPRSRHIAVEQLAVFLQPRHLQQLLHARRRPQAPSLPGFRGGRLRTALRHRLVRGLRRGFGGDSRGHRGLHDLANLGVRILLREVPRGESLRVGAARIEALLEEEPHDVGLERQVDGGDGLAVPHRVVQRRVAFGVDELENVVRGARIEVALAGFQVQPVDRVEERLPVKRRNRGNRVAERGEVAGGGVFEEMVAETDRRFARLKGRNGERGYQRARLQIAPVGDQRGKEVPVEEKRRPVQRSTAETVRLIRIEPDGEQLVHDLWGLGVRRKMESTVGSEIAGVMEGKQTIGSSVEFTVRTFVVRLNIF